MQSQVSKRKRKMKAGKGRREIKYQVECDGFGHGFKITHLGNLSSGFVGPIYLGKEGKGIYLLIPLVPRF